MAEELIYTIVLEGQEKVENGLDALIKNQEKIINGEEKLSKVMRQTKESTEAKQTEYKRLSEAIQSNNKYTQEELISLNKLEKEFKESAKTQANLLSIKKDAAKEAKEQAQGYSTQAKLLKQLISSEDEQRKIQEKVLKGELDLSQAQREHAKMAENLYAKITILKKEYKEGGESSEEQRKALDKLEKAYQQNIKAASEYGNNLGDMKSHLKALTDADNDYLRIKDKVTKGELSYADAVKKSQANIELLEKEQRQLTSAIKAQGTATEEQERRLKEVNAELKQNIQSAKEYDSANKKIQNSLDGNTAKWDKLGQSMGQAGTIMSNLGGTAGALGGALGGIGSMAAALPGQFQEINNTMSGAQASMAKFAAGGMVAVQAAMMLYKVFDDLIKGQEQLIIENGKVAQSQSQMLAVYGTTNQTFQDRVDLVNEVAKEDANLAAQLRANVGNADDFAQALKNANDKLRETRELGKSKEFEVNATGGGLIGFFVTLTADVEQFTEAVGQAQVALEDINTETAAVSKIYESASSDMTSYIGSLDSQISQLRISIAQARGDEQEVRRLTLEGMQQERDLLKENIQLKIEDAKARQVSTQQMVTEIRLAAMQIDQAFSDIATDGLNGYTKQVGMAIRAMFPNESDFDELDNLFEGYIKELVETAKREGQTAEQVFDQIRQKFDDIIPDSGGAKTLFAFNDEEIKMYIRAALEIAPALDQATSSQTLMNESIARLEKQLTEVDPKFNEVIRLTKELWAVQDAAKNKDAKETVEKIIGDPEEVTKIVKEETIDPIVAYLADVGKDAESTLSAITNLESQIERLGDAQTEEAQATIKQNTELIKILKDRYNELTGGVQDSIKSMQALVAKERERNDALLDSGLSEYEKTVRDIEKEILDIKSGQVEATVEQTIELQNSLDEYKKLYQENEKITAEQEAQEKALEEQKKTQEELKKQLQERVKLEHDYWTKEITENGKQAISELFGSIGDEIWEANEAFETIKSQYQGFPEIIANEEAKYFNKLGKLLEKQHQQRIKEAQDLSDQLQKAYEDAFARYKDLQDEIADMELSYNERRKKAEDDVAEYLKKSQMDVGETKAYERAKQIAKEYEDLRNAGLEANELEEWLSTKRKEVMEDEAISRKQYFDEQLKEAIATAEATFAVVGTEAQQLQNAIAARKKELEAQDSLVKQLKASADEAAKSVERLLTGDGKSGDQKIFDEYTRNLDGQRQSFDEYMRSKFETEEQYQDYMNKKTDESTARYKTEYDNHIKGLEDRNKQLVKNSPFLQALQQAQQVNRERLKLHQDLERDLKIVEGNITADAVQNAIDFETAWTDAITNVKTALESLGGKEASIGEPASGGKKEDKKEPPSDVAPDPIAPGDFGDYGESVGNSYADGLENSKQTAYDAAIAVAEEIAKPLEAHSPPKEGPLKEINKWGKAAAEAYAEGWDYSKDIIRDAIYNALSTIEETHSERVDLLNQLRDKLKDIEAKIAADAIKISVETRDAYTSALGNGKSKDGKPGLTAELDPDKAGNVAAELIKTGKELSLKLKDAILSELNSLYDEGVNLGKAFGIGLAVGMDSERPNLIQMAQSLAADIASVFDKAGGASSAGQSAGSGYVNPSGTSGSSSSNLGAGATSNGDGTYTNSNGDTIVKDGNGGWVKQSQAGTPTGSEQLFFNSGQSVMKSYADGMASAEDDVLEAAELIAETIARPLEAHSPPDEGPLKDIDNWGYATAESYAEGWRVGSVIVKEAVDLIPKTIQGALGDVDTAIDDATESISRLSEAMDWSRPGGTLGVPGASSEIDALTAIREKLMGGTGVESGWDTLDYLYGRQSEEFEAAEQAAKLLRTKERQETNKRLMQPGSLNELEEEFYKWWDRGIVPEDLGDIDLEMLRKVIRENPEWADYAWLQRKLKEQYPELLNKAYEEGILIKRDFSESYDEETGELETGSTLGHFHKSKVAVDFAQPIVEGMDTFNEWLQKQFLEWKENSPFENVGLSGWADARQAFFENFSQSRLAGLVSDYKDYISEIAGKGFEGNVEDWFKDFGGTQLGEMFTEQGSLEDAIKHTLWGGMQGGDLGAITKLFAGYEGDYTAKSALDFFKEKTGGMDMALLTRILGLPDEYSIARGWSSGVDTEGDWYADVDQLAMQEVLKNIELIDEKLKDLGVESPEQLIELIKGISKGHEYGLHVEYSDVGQQVVDMIEEIKAAGKMDKDVLFEIRELMATYTQAGKMSREEALAITRSLIPDTLNVPDEIIGAPDYDPETGIWESPFGPGFDTEQVIGNRFFNPYRSDKQSRAGQMDILQPGPDPYTYFPELGGGQIVGGRPTMEGIDLLPVGAELVSSGVTTGSGIGNFGNAYFNFNINIETFTGDTGDIQDLADLIIEKIVGEADTRGVLL